MPYKVACSALGKRFSGYNIILVKIVYKGYKKRTGKTWWSRYDTGFLYVLQLTVHS